MVLQIVNSAREQALEARERARLSEDDHARAAWLDLASTWERIAEQYFEIQKLRESHPSLVGEAQKPTESRI